MALFPGTPFVRNISQKGTQILSGCNGTWTLSGVSQLCGQRIYFSLPANWSGLYAPVSLSDHSIVVSAKQDPNTIWSFSKKAGIHTAKMT